MKKPRYNSQFARLIFIVMLDGKERSRRQIAKLLGINAKSLTFTDSLDGLVDDGLISVREADYFTPLTNHKRRFYVLNKS